MRLLVSYNLKEQVNSSIVLQIEKNDKFEKTSQRLETAATDVFISPGYLQTQILPRD